MEKKPYTKPEIKVVEFKPEKGFASSSGSDGGTMSYEDALGSGLHSFSYDPWGWTRWSDGGIGGNDNF